ncbi:MAG TPA: GAF domain-containing protein [Thermodesulfobacteriota bacterium]|nr:GAF domain-containing protein [Thermodesulfobacteriota bacterium]
MTQSVHQSINLQEVLENAVKAMNENIDRADIVAIYSIEGKEAILKAYTGFIDLYTANQFIERAERIPYPKGLTWKTIMERKPIYCADVDQDTVIGSAGKALGIKSYLSMPVGFESKTVGTLNITSFQKNAFSEEELKLMEIVARQIEIAIDNAKQAEALRRSEEALLEAKEELEIKVNERTTELRKANECLLTEIIERKRAEEQLRTLYKLSDAVGRAETVEQVYEAGIDGLKSTLHADRASVLIFDQNGVMRFKVWRGLSDTYRNQIEGHSPWSANEKDPKPILIHNVEQEDLGHFLDIILGEGIRALAFIPLVYQGRLLGKFMVYFNSPHQFTDDEVQLMQTIAGHIADALERKRTEEQIKKSLREKELLLKEIHHRVKNNLQVISSLLNLQAPNITDMHLQGILLESCNRIRSMALVHEQLYRACDITQIDFYSYLKSLVKDLLLSYSIQPDMIKVNLSVQDILFDIDTAIPCGLLINELISNCLKHAFPLGQKGEIYIAIRRQEGNRYRLTVKDTGVGFPAELDIQNIKKSLGLRLVMTLTKQLQGNATLERSNGTTFHIDFAEIKYKERR